MTLDELLLEWSYRSERGYPSVDNPSDVLLLKTLLEKLDLPVSEIISNIKEGTKAANSRKAIDTILSSKYAEEHRFKKMSNAYRLGNLDKIDKDTFIAILQDLFNNSEVKVYGPKSGPNKSSKYNMFEFDLEEEGQVQIVLAGGANKGEIYEQDLLSKMQASLGMPMEDIEFPDIQKLFKALKIDSEDYIPDDINFMGAADTKRQLSFDGPTNLGAKVADVVIDGKSGPIYLSIKDQKGSGIYNGGNVTFVYLNDEGKAIFDQSKYNDKPLFKEIFEACGIDPQRMADGINSYITKEGERGNWESSINVNLEKIKKLLSSSFGYGYWYVREKKGDDIFVHYIDGEQGAYDMVGDLNPSAVKIKYPGTTSKNLDVVIETDSPVFQQDEGRVPLKYQIVIRNASGKILPARLNIRTNK